MIPELGHYFQQTKHYLKNLSERQKIIKHCGSIGSAREDNLIKIIKPIIPSDFDISKSILLDSLGEKTGEFDIVISTTKGTPKLMDIELTFPVFVENVVCVIEVKSRIDKNSFKKYNSKLLQLKNLTRVYRTTDLEDRNKAILNALKSKITNNKTDFHQKFKIGALKNGPTEKPIQKIKSVLFGYKGPQLKTILDYQNSFEEKPEIIIILDKGCFYWDDKISTYKDYYKGGPCNDMEIGLMLTEITKWIERKTMDNLFLMSNLTDYVYSNHLESNFYSP